MKFSNIMNVGLAELGPAKCWPLASWAGPLLTLLVLCTRSPPRAEQDLCSWWWHYVQGLHQPFNLLGPWISNCQAEDPRSELLLTSTSKQGIQTGFAATSSWGELIQLQQALPCHNKARSSRGTALPLWGSQALAIFQIFLATSVLKGVTPLQKAQRSPVPGPRLTCQKGTIYIWRELGRR